MAFCTVYNEFKIIKKKSYIYTIMEINIMTENELVLIKHSGLNRFLVDLTFKNRLSPSDFFKIDELVDYKLVDDDDLDEDEGWSMTESSEKSKDIKFADNELKSGKIEVPEGMDVCDNHSYNLKNVIYDYVYYSTDSDSDILVVEGKLFYQLANYYDGTNPLDAIEYIIIDFEFWVDEKFLSLGNAAIKYSNVQANVNNIRSENKTLESIAENINVIPFNADNGNLPANIKLVSKDKKDIFPLNKLQRTDYKLDNLGFSFNFYS